MTLLMHSYIVRHVATGKHLPDLKKGTSWWDPSEDNYSDGGKPPRLFKNKNAANRFIISWAMGHHISVTHRGEWPYEDWQQNKIKDVGRSRDMLEAVQVQVLEIPAGAKLSSGMFFATNQNGSSLMPGDLVEKVEGYRFPGKITAVDMDDPDLYLVRAEHPDINGMRHVFRGKQLRRRS